MIRRNESPELPPMLNNLHKAGAPFTIYAIADTPIYVLSHIDGRIVELAEALKSAKLLYIGYTSKARPAYAIRAYVPRKSDIGQMAREMMAEAAAQNLGLTDFLALRTLILGAARSEDAARMIVRELRETHRPIYS